jgi:hypothetical protein
MERLHPPCDYAFFASERALGEGVDTASDTPDSVAGLLGGGADPIPILLRTPNIPPSIIA